MNSIIAIYYLEPLITCLSIAIATALLIGFRPYEWLNEQFMLPKQPFMCPKCLAFWLALIWTWQEPWKITLAMALITALLAEVVDQKINLKYE